MVPVVTGVTVAIPVLIVADVTLVTFETMKLPLKKLSSAPVRIILLLILKP
jgi:hypothetical protein